MNDLLTIIKVGQQRSRMIRLNIITARRFLASKNQFQLAKEHSPGNWCATDMSNML